MVRWWLSFDLDPKEVDVETKVDYDHIEEADLSYGPGDAPELPPFALGALGLGAFAAMLGKTGLTRLDVSGTV